MTPLEIVVSIKDNLTAGLKTAGQAVQQFAKDAQTHLKALKGLSEELHHTWGNLFNAVVGAELIKNLADIALGAEEASAKLEMAAASAEGMGHAFNMEEAKKWVSDFASFYGENIDKVRQVWSKFIEQGATPEAAKRLTTDAENAAKKFGMSIDDAASIIDRGMTRSVAALSKFGIQVHDSNNKLISFEEGMKRLESRVNGSAEAKSNDLAASIARLGNAGMEARDRLGTALIPILEDLTNALTRVVEAFASLPDWVQTTVAVLAVAGVGLLSIALILPTLVEGVTLLGKGVVVLGEAFSFLAGKMALSAPQLLLITALIAAILVLVIESIRNWDALSKQIHNAARMIGDVLTSLGRLVGEIFGDMGAAWQGFIRILSGDILGGVNAVNSAFDNMKDHAVKRIGEMGTAYAKMAKENDKLSDQINRHMAKDWNAVTHGFGLFDSTKGKHKPDDGSGAHLVGLGDKGQKAKDDSAKALRALEASIKDQIERLDEKIVLAKQAETDAKNKLKNLLETFAGGKPTTSKEHAEARAASAEIEKSVRTQIALNEQKETLEKSSIARLAAFGATHKSVADQVRASIDSHHKAYIGLLGTVSNLKQTLLDIKKATEDTRWAGILELAANNKSDLGVSREHEKANLLGKRRGIEIKEDAASTNAALHDHALPAAEVEHFKVAIAEADRQLALLAIAEARDAVNAAHRLAVNARTDSEKLAAHQALNAAEIQTTQASISYRDAQFNLTKATNALVIAQHDAAEQTKVIWGNLAKDLAAKLNIPGLEANKNNGGAGLAMNWTTFLMDAIAQTKSFADVMKVVSEIMRVVGQILDAFRPVIDTLLRIVVACVNVFVGLYNSVAYLLRLLGIHVAILDRLNANFNDLNGNVVPLIQIMHDSPTMNELASGKVGPLEEKFNNFATNTSTPIVTAVNDGTSAITNVLGAILAGILAIKIATAVKAGADIFHSILGMFNKSGSGVPNFTGPDLNIGSGGGPMIPPGYSDVNISQGALDATGNGGMGDLTTAASGASKGLASFAAYLPAAVGAFSELASLFSGGSSANAKWSDVGGLIGTGIGAVLGGPIGASIGQALGSVVGGLFGPHWKAGTAPDRESTQQYGQGLADLQGQSGDVNGQRFSEQSGLKNQLHGQSELQAISAYLAKGGHLGGGMDQEFAGASGVTNLHDGILTLNNGTKKFWSDLMADAQAAIGQIGSSFGDMGQNVRSMAQGINLAMGQTANELHGVVSATSGVMDTLTNSLASAVSGSSSSSANNSTHNITVNHTTNIGQVNGIDDVEEISKAQAEMTQRLLRTRGYLLTRTQ